MKEIDATLTALDSMKASRFAFGSLKDIAVGRIELPQGIQQNIGLELAF